MPDAVAAHEPQRQNGHGRFARREEEDCGGLRDPAPFDSLELLCAGEVKGVPTSANACHICDDAGRDHKEYLPCVSSRQYVKSQGAHEAVVSEM